MSFAGVSVVRDGELCLSSSTEAARKASAGYHLLVIDGYSSAQAKFREGFPIRSSSFVVGGCRWHIRCYPTDGCTSNSDFMFLDLACHDCARAPLKAKYRFSFVDEVEQQEPTQIHAIETCTFRLNEVRGRRFIKREALERSKHLKDDCFTIRCDIIVVDGKKTENAASGTAPFAEVPPSQVRRDFSDMLKMNLGTDVTFQVGGVAFAAHRCVLAARSSVFKAELFGPMKEGAPASTVQIDDMEPQVFRALLSFIYTDFFFPTMERNNIMEEDDIHHLDGREEDDADADEEEQVAWLQHLLVAADRYDLQRLKLFCQEELNGHIDVRMVGTILALAERHCCYALKEACLEFLKSPEILRDFLEADGMDYINRSCPSVVKELLAKFASPRSGEQQPAATLGSKFAFPHRGKLVPLGSKFASRRREKPIRVRFKP